MIKVLHLRDTNKICGPGKTILETACRIDRSRFELSVGLFLLSSETKNSYRDEVENRKIQVIPLVAKSQFSPEIINKTIHEIQKNKIDIVHSHDYKSDILTALIAKRIKIPVITTAHGWITNSLKSKIYVWLGKQSFRFFDHIIAVSPKIYNEVLRFGVKKEKLSLVYNAIVEEDYREENTDKGYLRNRFNISEETKIIGNIGRLSPEKGQIDFILAAKQIIDVRKDVAFIITGDGPDRKRIEALIEELNIQTFIYFTGHEKDVKPIFRDLDIFALTSHTEGFPNVVLESLCMNTPVLATDVGGTAEIITDKKTGILVNSGNIEEIQSGIKYLLDNPKDAKKLTQTGKQKVMDFYEFKTRVNKIERIYEKLMTDKAKENV